MSIGSSRWMRAMSRAIALGRVVREAEDVAGEGEHLGAAPRLQHGAVLGDLVLPFLEAALRFAG